MSADKIDHKEQATNLLESIHLDTNDIYEQTPEARGIRLDLALVHATLYAAEQQRIANLIALESAEFVMADEWIPASEGRTRIVDAEKTMKRYENASRIIVDGLGLA